MKNFNPDERAEISKPSSDNLTYYFDPDKKAQVSSEIKYSKDFCDISEDQKKQKLLMKEKRRRIW